MSETLDAPHCGALKSMFWRSEILQVMYWLRGEGFGEEVDAGLIERFLGVDAEVGIDYLDQLVEEGLIDRIGDLYTLSELGKREAGLEFAIAFDDLTNQAHGECGPDCPHCFPPEGVDSDCTEGCPAFELSQEASR
ncbi:MAG: hypothetical protein AB1673_12290 [Actinomycetota bacterium]